jgi:hypothetical protein
LQLSGAAADTAQGITRQNTTVCRGHRALALRDAPNAAGVPETSLEPKSPLFVDA